MTAETKEKLFLPYFSTKARGTGLGLAIVARILEDHGGTVRVEENHPVGTRFLVELPVAGSERTSGASHASLRVRLPALAAKSAAQVGPGEVRRLHVRQERRAEKMSEKKGRR